MCEPLQRRDDTHPHWVEIKHEITTRTCNIYWDTGVIRGERLRVQFASGGKTVHYALYAAAFSDDASIQLVSLKRLIMDANI